MDNDERTAAATIQIAEDDPDAREFCPPLRILALSFFNPLRDTIPPDPTKVPDAEDEEAARVIFPPVARFAVMRVDDAWYESPATYLEDLLSRYETKWTTKWDKKRPTHAQVAWDLQKAEKKALKALSEMNADIEAIPHDEWLSFDPVNLDIFDEPIRVVLDECPFSPSSFKTIFGDHVLAESLTYILLTIQANNNILL